MSRVLTHLLNGLALVVAVGVCVLIAVKDAPARTAEAGPDAETREVRDTDNVAVPVRAYQRIASLSPNADAILLETISASRVVGVSGTLREGLGPQRFESLHVIEEATVEQVLALDPDLVIVGALSFSGQVQQLRDANIAVFRMGEMRGVRSFVQDARDIGRLVGEGARGEEVGARLERRMRMVAADIPLSERPRGLYLGVLGRGLYGGANRTSFHDVLEAAGLRDVLAHMDSWPELTPEQVLELDPDVVLVPEGTARVLCDRDGLRTLRVCLRDGDAQVVELPSEVLNDPGMGMLLAAERLRMAVHGAPASVTPSPSEEPSPE